MRFEKNYCEKPQKILVKLPQSSVRKYLEGQKGGNLKNGCIIL